MPTAGVSITGILLQADARGEPLGPLALTFLVRRYAATGAEELRGALERGLTTGLEGLASENRNKAGWIQTLCEAAAVADDERIGDGVMRAARGLCAGWPSRGAIVDAMRDVDACLTAALVLDERGRDVAGAAVDELERVMCIAYHPGEMLPRSLQNPEEPDGGIEEHVAAASALLTAHDLTARLPYSMLAEELIQAVRRPGGPHETGQAEGLNCAGRCALARVLGRLARLHDDDDYRRAAVIARSCDYRAEAKAELDAIAALPGASTEDAAMFGVAMDEVARPS
jgi:hypothetical protein